MTEKIYALEIFKGIEKDVVEKIINNCKQESFSENSQIIVEGDASNGRGYIIKTGRVAVYIGLQKVAELSGGNIFGEIALLNEEKRTATVKALTDVEVIVLSFQDLIEIINNDDNTINKTIISRIEGNLERS